ncbi:M48 family metalloprotease, partial [bacterium]|nr:M48 family metalloprotease [bacterium]
DANAFALPGGFVYVTTGLLDLGLEDSELAFILAHEIAHNECDHIFKIKKTVDLLSVLMVGLEIFAMTHISPSKDANEIRAESAARSLAYSLSGAMIASGYSRKFEKEADFWGRIYLAKAGFDVTGSKTALEKIDIMKRQRPDLFSSLLMTHPYILDRLNQAEESPITFSQDIFIKKKTKQAGNFIQDYLVQEAQKYETKDKKVLSLLLYRNAYYIYPSGNQADKVLYELIKNREEKERKKNKFLTNWNYLIKHYETLLKNYPATSLKKEVTAKLESVKKERDEVYKWYEEKIRQTEGSGQLDAVLPLDYYSNFIEFFPESPLVPKARYFLAKAYISANEYDKSLNELITLMKNPKNDHLPARPPLAGKQQAGWGRKAKEEIVTIIDKSTDIVLLGRLLVLDFSVEVKAKVNTRLKETIPEIKEPAPIKVSTKDKAKKDKEEVSRNPSGLLLTGLAQLDKFSKEFPESEHKEIVAKRKAKLAQEQYIEARAQSLSGNWYKTVTIYRKILKYAPDTVSAKQIRQEFDRLEQLRRNETG